MIYILWLTEKETIKQLNGKLKILFPSTETNSLGSAAEFFIQQQL